MNPRPRFLAAWIPLAVMATAALLMPGCAGHSELRGSSTTAGADGRSGQSSGPAPLVVNRDAPLLLDGPAGGNESPAKPATGPVADNSTCFVCHANYIDEPLVGQHAAANVGCVNCHGESIAHKNDENNTTPPETMYPAETINPACKKCHLTHDAEAAKVIARWQERSLTQTDLDALVCTDCHGDHRLAIRTVRWNKRTGKLLRGAAQR